MAHAKILVIKETEKEIKNLLKQSIPFIGQRLRVLLILKQNEKVGISKREVAKLAVVDPNSVQNWRTLYLNSGIEGLMKHQKTGFKPSAFNAIEHNMLETKLNDPQNGLQGYVELKDWIEKESGKTFNYNTLLYYCIRNFKSSVKVARKSRQKDEDQESLLKDFGRICQEIALNTVGDFDSVNLYFQDESRFGLFTRNGKSVTAISVKPICAFQQVFKSTWLSGAFSPITGDHFQLILPHCNADNFQVFLDNFSKENPKELKIMVLDNGRFHKAKKLIIPENIVLVFLPPYSPELNPAEKMWAKYKREFSNKFYNSLEDVEDFITNVVKATSKKEVMSICGYSYVFLDKIWAI
ncbi:IS630 family transposase [Flavobacterium sp. K5-23]|uniref:IS630 family transposase n=1 Tax=Flavobacterium sp. K5-23 TaxID=2746225 RepID=UPI00200BF03B|nr:IS630 family transposase [Flavobacterium sp. K5-23]UQD57140.1 IS630 family transposase [Flavobacterium sp. K5-23]